MLPSSSTQQPARLLKTEKATPNAPPTWIGNPVVDSTPGGAAAALAMSAIGNASTPLRINVPFASSRNPLSVSVNDTYSISPTRLLNGANAPLTFGNDVRSHTGLTANPVMNTWSSLFKVPNAFNTVGRLIVSTFGAGVCCVRFVVDATYRFPNESA